MVPPASTRVAALTVASEVAAANVARAYEAEPESVVVVNRAAQLPVRTTEDCAVAWPLPFVVTVQRDRSPLSKSSLNNEASRACCTTMSRVTALGSVLPAASVAFRASVWRPGERPVSG